MKNTQHPHCSHPQPLLAGDSVYGHWTGHQSLANVVGAVAADSGVREVCRSLEIAQLDSPGPMLTRAPCAES
jgi:hypothetical protein